MTTTGGTPNDPRDADEVSGQIGLGLGEADELDVAEDELDAETLAASVADGEREDPEDVQDGELGDADGPAFGLVTGLTGSVGRPLPRRAAPLPASTPDLTRALSGDVPLFLIHKGAHFGTELPRAMGRLPRETNGNVGLGTVVRLPQQKPEAASQFLASMRRAPLRLADPELWRHPAQGWAVAAEPSAVVLGRVPWLARTPAPSDPADAMWVQEVLDAQHAAGATAFLSATGWVTDAQGAISLADAMRWVAASRAAVADAPMFVNMALPSTWLTTPALRSALLLEMNESNEKHWYLRFYWPIVDPRYGQLREAALLEGYKLLASNAAAEGKVLILPNTGLTGWIATALGATGFSTGIGWPEQAFGEQRRGGGQPGVRPPPARPRYFDRTILHTVDWTDYQRAVGLAGHMTCRCRFSRLLPGPPWDKPSAGLHYLLQAARLQALLAVRHPRPAAEREVVRAQQFVSTQLTGPASFTDDARPAHLPLWAALLH